MKYTGNIGFLFQHLYYAGIDFLADKDSYENEKKFKSRNDELFSISDSELHEILKSNVHLLPYNFSFLLSTTYPGLVAGTGYVHETGMKGEMKLGFSFDFTTGLPVIPGSTVKGVIRSWLENKSILDDLKSQLGLTFNWDYLKKECFENDQKSTYESDIFFDATVSGIENSNFKSYEKRLLGEDNLCPHKNPLKNPVPISFLKVMPEVVFEFKFKLNDDVLKGDEKKKLYMECLLMAGIGAKTNVGYGQFKDSET